MYRGPIKKNRGVADMMSHIMEVCIAKQKFVIYNMHIHSIIQIL